MNSLVSVVIPIFNSCKYLKACLDSIAQQTYQNLECILIDDGSTDSSGKICDDFCAQNHQFRVIHNINCGVARSRNLGIELSHGKYLMFVDSDDIISANMIESMVREIENDDSDICFCKYDKFDEDGFYLASEKNMQTNNYNTVEEYYDGFVKYFFISQSPDDSVLQMGSSCRILYKKEKITSMFDGEIFMCEDLLFVLNNLKNVRKVSVVQDALYHYRINSSSVSNNYKKNYLLNQISFLDGLKSFVYSLSMEARKADAVYWAECAVYTYYLFSNELKYRRINKNTFKKNIKDCKKSVYYHMFTLKNWKRIKYKPLKIKYLVVYLTVKLNLYMFL